MGRFFSAPRRFFSCTPGEGVELARHEVRRSDLSGLRLLFLSDIHASARFSSEAIEALFLRAAALEPDIALLGGDLAEDAGSLDRFLRALSALRPRLGIFACKGNNDTELPGFEKRVAGRMRLLVNESVRVEGLRVGGVDEAKWGAPRAANLFPREENCFGVLLSHYPTKHDFGAGRRADLQLSGHTHGGQFNLLGFTPYTVLYEPFCHAWISGECRLGGVQTIVSNGVGMSRVPLRVGVPPQMHLIEFV